jgi:hypothetical protein
MKPLAGLPAETVIDGEVPASPELRLVGAAIFYYDFDVLVLGQSPRRAAGAAGRSASCRRCAAPSADSIHRTTSSGLRRR